MPSNQQLIGQSLVASVPPDPTNLTAEAIRSMSRERLEDPAVVDVIKDYVQELFLVKGLAVTETVGVIDELLRSYGELWKTSAPDIFVAYNELFILLQFHRLAAFNKTELHDLFQQHLLVAIKNDIDVLQLINDWMINYLMTRRIAEEFNAVIQGIRSDEEKIGEAPIIREDGREAEPTVRNWLIEFDVMMPSSEMPRGGIEESTFLSQNYNAQKLSADDRALLGKAIRILDALLFPGIHDVKEVVAHDAIPVREHRALPSHPLQPPVSSSEPVATKTAIVPPSPDAGRIQKIDAARGKLRESGKEAVVLFFDLLSHPQGVAPATADELAAGLMILAQDNALERAITDAKIRELFIAHLRSKNQPDLLEGFRLTPTMPKFMSLFLQWALTEKGKLSENDAAQIGARIANMLKKRGNEKYSRIAYFDAGSNQFKWS